MSPNSKNLKKKIKKSFCCFMVFKKLNSMTECSPSCLNSNHVAINENEVLCFTFGCYYGLKTTITWNQMTFKSADGFTQKQADMWIKRADMKWLIKTYQRWFVFSQYGHTRSTAFIYYNTPGNTEEF